MTKLKILLIDDEVDFVEVMNNRINSWGYEVISAFNGKKGLDSLMSQKPDVIILDYMMPKMDSITTLKQIRKIDRGIPVVMLTAYPDEKSLKGTKQLGISAYVPKVSPHTETQNSLKTALAMIEKKLDKKE